MFTPALVSFNPRYVLPNCLSAPECPFEVAKTLGATLAVLRVLVYADVENVRVAWPTERTGEEEKKTSAKPGAGTGMIH